MKLLVVRLSSMGDVAMLAPVLHLLLDANQNLEITVLTKAPFDTFFYGHDRLNTAVIQHKSVHKGLVGLWRLTQWIAEQDYDYIVDVHDNLRSRIICAFGRWRGMQYARFDKGRKEKNRMVKEGYNHRRQALQHTCDRYLNTFVRLGLSAGDRYRPVPPPCDRSLDLEEDIRKLTGGADHIIGVAPFAAHDSKVYPAEKLTVALKALALKYKVRFLLFGGRNEQPMLQNMASAIGNATCLPNHLTLADELCVISRIDLMIAMDSANMHMAAILGKRVVSIWGGTHPAMGFSPLFNEDGIIQADLDCRPSTVYGKVKQDSDRKCAQQAFDAVNPIEITSRVSKWLDQ